MKRVGILETRVHPTYLYATTRIMEAAGANISIFTVRENFDLMTSILDMDKYNWMIKNETETTGQFLKRVRPVIEKEVDTLYVNTIQGGLRSDIWQYYRFNPDVKKKILTIHNPRHWFEKGRLPGFKGRLEYLLRQEILKKYDAVVAVSGKVKKYIIEKCHCSKPVYFIPFSIHDPYEIPRDDTRVVFASSGAIEERRRDYQALLDIFEKISAEYPNVQLKILGKPVGDYGSAIIGRCQDLRSRGFGVFAGDKYLDMKTFEAEMRSADILIGAINMSLYDESKETGIVYDAIRFAKPLLMPEGYDIPQEIQSSTVSFENYHGLEKIIRSLIVEKEKLERLIIQAGQNSLFFVSSSVAQRQDIGL